jgi:ABC-type phosphate transport system substrate-binding protein
VTRVFTLFLRENHPGPVRGSLRKGDVLVRAMKRPDKSLVLLWALVIVSIVLSAAGLRAVIFRRHSGQAPGFLLGTKGRTKNAGGEGPSHATVKVAGSGTNLPITRILAREFKMVDPAVPVVVYDSIGSRGAVRALGDGVIDVGLVSRRLKESERREDFEIIPYARTLAAFGVNASVREDDITSRDLVAIYEGKKTKWMDGSPIVVLQREASDSTNEILFRIFPAFKKANEAAYGRNRWRVLFTDDDMLEALEDTEGAIGPTDTGAVAAGARHRRRCAVAGTCRERVLPPCQGSFLPHQEGQRRGREKVRRFLHVGEGKGNYPAARLPPCGAVTWIGIP